MSGQPWVLGKLTRKRADGTTYWTWCIKWADERGAHRESLGTSDRAAAEAHARDLWQRRTLASADTVGEIVEAYLDSLGGLRDEKRKREAWVAAKPYWAGLRMHQIDDQTSAGYQAQRKRAANTMRNELGLIRTALKWAVGKRIIQVAPPIFLPPMPESETEHLSKPQFRKFLAGCRAPHVKLFAQLAVTTGARAKALLELPWVRVDLDSRTINLNPRDRIQKENKRRAVVPINDRLYPLLVDAKEAALTPFVIESGGSRIASIKKGIEAASKRSGVHCTPHMFRHSAAVWMAEDRVPMEEIAAYLGHKNTAITTRVYARFNPDYLRRAAASLDW